MESINVKSPTNIALIKYWGKSPGLEDLNIPTKSSISFTVENLFTETLLKVKEDDFSVYISLNGRTINNKILLNFFNNLNYKFTKKYSYEIITKNNFPTSAGFASSASGFSALALAFAKIMEKLENVKFTEREISILARLGSGSAARSIPFKGGLTLWHNGNNSENSYAETIYKKDYFKDLSIFYVILNSSRKKVKSRLGMEKSVKMPDYWKWVDYEEKILLPKMLNSIKDKNWNEFFNFIKEASDNFHEVCFNSDVKYLNEKSYEIINQIKPLDYAAYTFDAGPNPVVITTNEGKINSLLVEIAGRKNVIKTKVGNGPVIKKF